MKKLNSLLLLFSVFILTSCDPAHNINFINNGSTAVKVTLKIDPKTEDYHLNQYKTGDSIVFNLKPALTEDNQYQMSFGIGTWHEKEMIEVSNSIKSIEIENINYKIIYKSQYSIAKVLSQNRKGYWMRTDIDFNINDDLLN
ncbi:hypothetical protein HNP37_003549 [Flavobacterium nitrogenifigens]|uniref:Uncharacterized protein n=2 Tax=Flavobacterium TaxID=237 RepID=A0A7W7IZJ1_9FLAO|nr:MULTISPECIES: hypothetical protein [Flavobacterium]MBB4803474.1 hypothetical protein [Flavobacterium nitrogenifigens]MBB6388721.1 hypothetical protein [Flavobacterium notoginsengisoli]